MQVNYQFTNIASIILWSLSAILLTNLTTPPLEALIITQTIAALLIFIKISLDDHWRLLRKNLNHIIITGLFLAINNLCYYLAFQYATAAMVDLICWLWPTLLVLANSAIYSKKINKVTWVALAMSTSAIIIAFPININQDSNYFTGIILSLFAVFSWCGYALLAKKEPQLPATFAVIAIAVFLPVNIALHYFFEPTIMPQINDYYIILALGLGPASLAFCCWDYTIKHGPLNTISVTSCATPVLSILLLVCFNKAELSINLIIAIVLLVISNILMITNKKSTQRECNL